MAKKTLFIILGAILVFGLIFVLWSWFTSGNNSQNSSTGTFGSAGNKTGTTGNGGGTTSGGQVPLSNTSGNGSLSGSNGAGSGGTSRAGSANAGIGGGTITLESGNSSVQGVDWLGSNAGTGSIGGTGFNPLDINGVNGGSIGGTVPTIGGTIDSGSSGGLNFLTAFGAAAGIGAITCGAQQFLTGTGAFAGAGTAATAGGAVAGVPVGGALLTIIAANQTTQTGAALAKQQQSFQACITNVIAKAILQQITSSIVNWINSGFNGSPSFVTNYQQFFTNVADLAAGQFIQGSGLSFLCSPFQLQIRIAIAQSYANRNAQSCTLSKVISNINAFTTKFQNGGWPGFLSFTTVPTNNPFGAFAYAQVGLAAAQNQAQQNAASNITPTGFIGFQKQICNGGASTNIVPTGGLYANTQAAKAAGACPTNCTCSVATPGGVIESSLTSANDTTLKQLGIGNDLDQIINALMQQLVVKTLYNGLSSLSGQTGVQSAYQTPDQVQAQAQAQAILDDMQNKVSLEEQLGSIAQGSIGDIEQAQANLNDLQNCWSAVASSSSPQANSAAASLAGVNAQFDSLNAQIGGYNDDITAVNNTIAVLEQLQTQALSVASVSDVQALQSAYTTAQSTITFAADADVATAQQNRTTLQAQMTSLNSDTQYQLAQCNAIPLQ